MGFELIIFDLDGTLADTKLDLANAVNATRAYFGLPPLPPEEISTYVGNGAPMLIRRSLGEGFTEDQLERGLEYFLNRYREHMLDHTRLYPGVRETLEQLRARGIRMAILTNKPVRFSQDIVNGLGVGDYFFRVYGGNSFPTKKPDPEGVWRIMEEAGVSSEKVLMVGDSAVDVRTARNAGVAVCGVTYGFQPESLKADPPDILIDSMDQLLAVLDAGQDVRGAEKGELQTRNRGT